MSGTNAYCDIAVTKGLMKFLTHLNVNYFGLTKTEISFGRGVRHVANTQTGKSCRSEYVAVFSHKYFKIILGAPNPCSGWQYISKFSRDFCPTVTVGDRCRIRHIFVVPTPGRRPGKNEIAFHARAAAIDTNYLCRDRDLAAFVLRSLSASRFARLRRSTSS